MTNDLLQKSLKAVTSGYTLPLTTSENIVKLILSGEAEPLQVAGLLSALATRGETYKEVVGAAMAMRANMLPLDLDTKGAIDCCGTGGSGRTMFNCSTAAAFVASACGVKVIKHGNRSANSPSGSADVLERAGVNLTELPKSVPELYDSCGICFLFAPNYHPAMRHVGPVRAALKIQTLFNLLGPLCNPASIKRQVIGVTRADRLTLMSKALLELGTEHAQILHARDGLDEVSPLAVTNIVEVRGSKVKKWDLDGTQYAGAGTSEDLQVESGVESLEKVKSVLSGDRGICADIVNLNAAMALAVAEDDSADKAFGAYFERVSEVQRSGQALALFEKFVEISRTP